MQALSNHLQKYVSIAPLVIFRIIFGLMVLFSTMRFMLKGWVYDLYIAPKFFFTYYGLDWVVPFSKYGMYTVFVLMLVSAIGIILGYFYKLSTITFFLLFTYVELLDKTNYLNHYYFVSLVSFLLIIVPAGNHFSLDVFYKRTKKILEVPNWTIDIFKFQVGVVYFFAGVAKLNYHWLIEAQPLTNWLKHQTDLPAIGALLKYKFTAFAFAWGGALYDLTIPFLLLSSRYRLLGYFLVVVFHTLTAVMFPIGVFPYVMIGSTLIFFSSNFHQKCLDYLSDWFKNTNNQSNSSVSKYQYSPPLKSLLILFVIIQLALPFRYLLYPGKLFWTEQGYRFSWRVMLIEKVGYAQFSIKDKSIDGELIVDNSTYLTPQQEKMMATQPDMILQYAHYLKATFKDSTWQENNTTIAITNPVITVDSKVVLFNQGSRTFINPTTNLAELKRGWHSKNWILAYE
ncbi:MAG: HTTM domain-containing protein [Crocinitomicaceae bacterium]